MPLELYRDKHHACYMFTNLIEEEARQLGMRTMYEDGLVKAMQGVTTIEEILRVTQEN